MTTVVVAGMHRSGTSILAQMIHHLNVPMGERLYEATVNNPYGHYEDLDFVEFHMAILERCCGHNWLVDRAPSLTDADRDQARAIAASRRSLPVWGWKDPRTTLFLHEWQRLLERPVYVFIWRRCADVMSSAARRSRRELNPVTAFRKSGGGLRNRLFQAKKVRSYTHRYAACWLLYNQKLLSFMQSEPERCLLFHMSDLTTHPNLLRDRLMARSEWPVPQEVDLSPLVDPKLLKSDVPDTVIPVRYRAEVVKVEQMLSDASTRAHE